MESTLTRALLGLVLLAGGLTAAMALCPHWLTESAGRPATPAPSLSISPPCTECRVLAHRVRMKLAIARQVVDEEMGLLEAAALFYSLRAPNSVCPDTSWQGLPGKSEGEKVCRQVIVWAVSDLMDTPRDSELETTRRRLEKELEGLKGPDGVVRLPSQ